jgi:hypothetical protein
MRFEATSVRPRGHDPWVLLAASVVGRAVADLHERHYAGDARHFLVTRLREPDNLWSDLLGDLRPSPTHVLAVVRREQALTGRPGR